MFILNTKKANSLLLQRSNTPIIVNPNYKVPSTIDGARVHRATALYNSKESHLILHLKHTYDPQDPLTLP